MALCPFDELSGLLSTTLGFFWDSSISFQGFSPDGISANTTQKKKKISSSDMQGVVRIVQALPTFLNPQLLSVSVAPTTIMPRRILPDYHIQSR